MKLFLIPYSLFLFFSSSFACDCQILEVKAARDSADIIFIGKATEVTTNWMSGGWKVTFVAEKSWKMATSGILVVNTPWEKDCGFMFEVGKSYLVYAKKKFSTKTTICSRTRLLSEASEDIVALEAGLTPSSKGKANFMIGITIAIAVISLSFLGYVITRGRNKKHKPVG